MNYRYFTNYNPNDERFWFPFLLGGLGGAAITSASRPRPVYVTGGQMGPYPYNYYGPRPYGYGYSGYNYYY